MLIKLYVDSQTTEVNVSSGNYQSASQREDEQLCVRSEKGVEQDGSFKLVVVVVIATVNGRPPEVVLGR
jgi:hypothetical protein